MSTLEFKLQLKETPVTIDDEPYVVVELDGRERDRYLGDLSKRVSPAAAGGASSVRNFDGLQASLVAVALRKIENGERQPVSIQTIQGWPASVIGALFKEAQILSALNVKNDEGND